MEPLKWVERAFAPMSWTSISDVIDGEELWTVVSETDQMRVLIMVFTMRDELVWAVTAYEASSPMRTVPPCASLCRPPLDWIRERATAEHAKPSQRNRCLVPPGQSPERLKL